MITDPAIIADLAPPVAPPVRLRLSLSAVFPISSVAAVGRITSAPHE
jgi:hypothetical protein